MTSISNNTPRPQIPLSELKGKEIPQGDAKVVSTASHDIHLESDYGNFKLPDFKLTQRHIEDPDVKTRIVDDASFDAPAIKTGADFKAKFSALLASNKAYLQPDKAKLLESLPEAARSNFAFINISGRRTEQFFDEMATLLNKTGLSGDEAKHARQALNFAHRDAFRGRAVDFDRADTGTYWSYGHDAPFVHVYEKMLAALPADSPKRAFIQKQLDFVFTHKFVPTGSVDENNAEKSMGLTAIDAKGRHVVSMVEGSEKSNRVSYETLRLPESIGGEHAGKHVYREGSDYFFEGSSDKVEAELVAKLEHSPVETVVMRRSKEGEHQRQGFRFDWNSNRMLDTRKIDTGWWGHCDIKAEIETILADMKGSAGVEEYNSASGKTTKFSRADQLEALAALLNYSDNYIQSGSSKRAMFGNTDFAGGRFDNRPTKMNLKTDHGSMSLNIRLFDLSENGDTKKNVRLDSAFATKIADDKMESFSDNPDILRTDERDVNYIDASKRKIRGTTDGYTFNSQGWPIESQEQFTIDPSKDDGNKVLIASELKDVANHKLERYYYDPSTKSIEKVATTFVEENGSFKAKEGDPQTVGKITGVELGQEMIGNDDIQNKLKMLDEAVRSGDKMATDSSLREEVWNGEVHRIRLSTEWRSDDGLWEREAINLDATFGSGKMGTVLHKLDDEGNIVESFETKPVVDFFWKDRPRVAPLISERGNWFINSAMADRGVVALQGDDLWTSMQALTDMNDLIYLGLKSKDDKPVYTIVHEGKRLVYEDKASWEADVKRLKGEETPVTPSVTGRIEVKSSPNMDIPDNDPAGISDSISVAEDGAVKGLTVDLDLKHTYVGDLTVSLSAPDGTTVNLHKRSGGGSDDLNGRFGDGLEAAESLAAFNGLAAKGDWTLKVVDSAGRDVGNLVSWGINIDTE